MIKQKLIEYRERNGVGRPMWDRVEDDNCLMHCWHMARQGFLSHAPQVFLKNKSEAVAMCSCIHSEVDTAGHIIFEIFDKSPMHRIVLLKPNIAVAIYTHYHQVYMTVRGW